MVHAIKKPSWPHLLHMHAITPAPVAVLTALLVLQHVEALKKPWVLGSSFPLK